MSIYFAWQILHGGQAWAAALAGLFGLPAGWALGALARVLPRRIERAWQEPADGAAPDAPPFSDCVRADWRLDARSGAMALLTGLAFAACVWRLGVTPAALCGMVFVAALISLAWIDAQTRLLPDALTLPLLWLGLLVNLHGALVSLPSAVLGAAAGYLFPWTVYHLMRWRTGLDGMGYGDFKLMAALGAWFGLAALPWPLLGAALAASAAGLCLRLAGRLQRGQALPFGPYLAASGILMFLGEVPVGHFPAT
ncbi:A24 family peptidase [Bordetella sp. FB-8]|uniref:prepilin peptidase n=1 Tax=Bordetella sp. FB-8 TaxID=1159870 RepID=UPI0003737F2B|nr:A24 family peptidase [Bordetella sp. FB-8]